jgi:hypothetical protein
MAGGRERERGVNALSSHESNKSPKLVSVDSQPADKTAGGLRQGSEMLWNCRAISGRARGRRFALFVSSALQGGSVANFVLSYCGLYF